MQTQRDHVEAQAFVDARMTAALITGDTRFLEAPMRRPTSGLMMGMVLGVLIMVAVVVVGLITHHKSPAAPAPSAVLPNTHAVVSASGPTGHAVPTTVQKG